MTVTPADNSTAIDWAAELDRHRDWMRGLVRARVGNADAADDVMQDVSLAVIRQNGRPTEAAKVRSWLYQVVVRRVADYFRRSFRHERLIVDAADYQSAIVCGNSDTTDANEEAALLKAALKNLPEVEREIFQRKYAENWSYRQLCEHFELSERAIEYRLVRAKERLRSELRALRTDEEYP